MLIEAQVMHTGHRKPARFAIILRIVVRIAPTTSQTQWKSLKIPHYSIYGYNAKVNRELA